jgi:hypothetical protein
MIKSLPTYIDFEDVSKQCLTQSFNLLFKVYEHYIQYDVAYIKDEVPIEDIWLHNTGTIRTSLILLHQGIETFMKSVICKTSPLLLIEKSRTDWPTLPSRADKDFDSLYTISGEALLTTFCAVPSEISIDEDLILFIEKIRQKRNEAIHGASKISVTAPELFEEILKAYTLFFGKDTWFLETWKFNFENPLFGYYDWDYEDALSYRYLDFAEFMIGRKKLSSYVTTDIKGRPYFCPQCKSSIDAEYGYLESKWAFLQPNKPTTKIIKCANCEVGFNVTREDCIYEDCKGNVIYSDDSLGTVVCLTCYNTQLDED